MLKRWVARDAVAIERAAEARASLVDAVLLARGLSEPTVAERFLNPKLTQLHDPSLIPDLDRAAERILSALSAGEAIVIYGDYDVDGITGSSILFHTLRGLKADANVSTYVPHRVDEGYGLHVGAMESLVAAGAKLIVSVDCGVTAVAPAKRARELGVDLIITDHHHPPSRLEDLPDAFAVVHPQRPDSKYPFDGLSGAGVAFKLAWRLATLHAGHHKVGKREQTLLLDLLPLAALGAIADVVPLVDENRVIAAAGLARAKASPFVGLRALIAAARLDSDKVSSWDVGFKLAPRLNACGRMAHASAAVELLTTSPMERARAIADELEMHNTERRKVERAIFEQAAAMAEAAGMTKPECRAIVLAHEEWHAGVVGIVCSRLVERFGRPTILMAKKDGHAHGSCRSIAGYDVTAALHACAGHLEKFGGHAMAAGLGLRLESLEGFTSALLAHAGSQISEEQLTAELKVDAVVPLEALTLEAVEMLARLEPHGMGNPGIKVMVPGVRLIEDPRPLGASGDHLALTVRGSESSVAMRVVAWGWGPRRSGLIRGQVMDLVVTPGVSTFTGRAKVEPELVDARVVV